MKDMYSCKFIVELCFSIWFFSSDEPSLLVFTVYFNTEEQGLVLYTVDVHTDDWTQILHAISWAHNTFT